MDKDTIKLVAAALVVITSSNATGYLNATNPSFRAESFSQLDAAIMKEKIMDKVRTMEHGCLNEMDSLDDRVHTLENDHRNYIKYGTKK